MGKGDMMNVGLNGALNNKFFDSGQNIDLGQKSALKSEQGRLESEVSNANLLGDLDKEHSLKERLKALASEINAVTGSEAKSHERVDLGKSDEVIKIDFKNATEQLAKMVHSKGGASEAGEHGFKETKHGPMRSLGKA